jgi:hypothetical protein
VPTLLARSLGDCHGASAGGRARRRRSKCDSRRTAAISTNAVCCPDLYVTRLGGPRRRPMSCSPFAKSTGRPLSVEEERVQLLIWLRDEGLKRAARWLRREDGAGGVSSNNMSTRCPEREYPRWGKNGHVRSRQAAKFLSRFGKGFHPKMVGVKVGTWLCTEAARRLLHARIRDAARAQRSQAHVFA